MQLIYLAPSVIPSRNANSIHVMKMLNAFKNNGLNVSLVVPFCKEKRENKIKDIFSFYGVSEFPLIYFPVPSIKGGKYLYSLLLALWLLFKKKDIIYSRDFYPAMFSAILGMPVIMEFHGLPKKASGLKGWLINRFYKSKKLKKIVVISNALRNIFIEDGFDSKKIVVAHDGSDPLPGGIIEFPLKGDFKVGYVGHLYKGRGMKIIISLAEKFADIDFHLAGGKEEDIVYWRKKTKSLKNLHLHGFIPPSKTDSFRVNCDVLLAPYEKQVIISDGRTDTSKFMSPLKIFEYMASGTPTLVSDLEIIKEVLNSETAFLCDPSKQNDWEKALSEAKKNKSLGEEKGNLAKKEFLSKYTWFQRAKNIIKYTA